MEEKNVMIDEFSWSKLEKKKSLILPSAFLQNLGSDLKYSLHGSLELSLQIT